MGEVLYLSKKFSGRRPDTANGDIVSAQILFFTGVRYQKYVEFADAFPVSPQGGEGPGHSKTKRKRRA